VLFDKIASVGLYFISKMYLYFSIGNGQPRERAPLYSYIGALSFPIGRIVVLLAD